MSFTIEVISAILKFNYKENRVYQILIHPVLIFQKNIGSENPLLSY